MFSSVLCCRRWPDKLDEALQKEKHKHQAELAALEQSLKENFVMERQIEKQKHQKLLEKQRAASGDGERELQQQVNALRQQLKSEATEFHKQIAENKARARELENDLRQEIQSLKKVRVCKLTRWNCFRCCDVSFTTNYT